MFRIFSKKKKKTKFIYVCNLFWLELNSNPEPDCLFLAFLEKARKTTQKSKYYFSLLNTNIWERREKQIAHLDSSLRAQNQKFRKGVGGQRGLARGDPSYARERFRPLSGERFRPLSVHFSYLSLGEGGHKSGQLVFLYFGPC